MKQYWAKHQGKVRWGVRTGVETSEGLYKSDLTRLLVTGKIPPKLETVYGVVLTAQRQAIDAIRPGAACQGVEARRSIAPCVWLWPVGIAAANGALVHRVFARW